MVTAQCSTVGTPLRAQHACDKVTRVVPVILGPVGSTRCCASGCEPRIHSMHSAVLHVAVCLRLRMKKIRQNYLIAVSFESMLLCLFSAISSNSQELTLYCFVVSIYQPGVFCALHAESRTNVKMCAQSMHFQKQVCSHIKYRTARLLSH